MDYVSGEQQSESKLHYVRYEAFVEMCPALDVFGAVRSCWLEHVVAEQGRPAPAGSTASSDREAWHMMQQKKKKQPDYLQQPPSLLLNRDGHFFLMPWDEFGQKVAATLLRLRLFISRGVAVLVQEVPAEQCIAVIQCLFLVF